MVRTPEIQLGQTETCTEVREVATHFKGKPLLVRSVRIGGRNIIVKGDWLKTASIQDEDLAEGEIVQDPKEVIVLLKNSALKADIFTFGEKMPQTSPRFEFHVEWDNLAVIPISTYSDWFHNRTDTGTRRAVRRAAKEGVVVRRVELDDAFVQGICAINNENPIRQGKRFWHFQKSFEEVKRENSTYSERNEFLGAYLGDRLIGFMRLTRVDGTASVIQLLSLMSEYDKRPANALIAKAVELCEKERFSHLVYCSYVYNDPKSSLTEFKRRNGFEMVVLPRYYVPLTAKGELAIRLGLHRGLVKSIPKPLLLKLLRLRAKWDQLKAKEVTGNN